MLRSTWRAKPHLGRAAGAALAAFLLALPAGAADGPRGLAAQEADGAARADVVSASVTLSDGGSRLELDTAGGEGHEVRLEDGRIVVDGTELGSYEPGGELDSAWRELLQSGIAGQPGQLGAELAAWDAPDAGGAGDALEAAIDRMLGTGPRAGGQEASDETPGAQESPAAEAEGTVTVTGPDGTQLVIAPGRISFGTLLDRLGRLDRALSRLDEEARGAAEELALIVHDDYALPRGRVIAGNLALLDGELRLAGEVEGDVLVLEGTLILEPPARVAGDVIQVGGAVEREGGQVAGDFLSARSVDVPPEVEDRTREELSEMREELRDLRRERRGRRPGFFDRTFGNIGRALGGVLGVVGAYLLMALAGLLGVYFVQQELEVVADTARANFGRSFGVGLAGQFLFFPVLLVLVVAVVTWLVIPFYVAASVVAVLAGYLALAHAAGEIVARQRFQYEWMERLRRSNSYYYVLSGLVVLLLPFALAEALHIFGGWLDFLRGLVRFVAVVITWVAATVGLGAVLLSRGGRRSDYVQAYTTEPPAQPGGEGGAA